MNTTTTGLAERVDELLLVLNKDLEHVERDVNDLDKLRELIIRRDDSGLNKLLEQIRSRSQEYIGNQKLREQLRLRIAEILDWPVDEVRLGKLQQIVSVEQKKHVGQVRSRLQGMISKLQSEHAGTVMLLADLTRFNSLLLSTIMEAGQASGITYNASGGMSRNRDVALMNLQF